MHVNIIMSFQKLTFESIKMLYIHTSYLKIKLDLCVREMPGF